MNGPTGLHCPRDMSAKLTLLAHSRCILPTGEDPIELYCNSCRCIVAFHEWETLIPGTPVPGGVERRHHAQEVAALTVDRTPIGGQFGWGATRSKTLTSVPNGKLRWFKHTVNCQGEKRLDVDSLTMRIDDESRA